MQQTLPAAPRRTIDVAIVGAGPIGLELAVAAKTAGLELFHCDAGPIGATIARYAPDTRFFSSPERIAIAGVPLVTVDQSKATREQYLAYLRGVVVQFGLEIHTYERVVAVERTSRGSFLLTSVSAEGRRETKASNVVLAIGDMHHARRLGVPGEDLPHVSHWLAEPHRYFRRRVLIVGGKNSAVEAAVRLWRVGAVVTLSYRGEDFDPDRIKFWLLPEIRALVREGAIRFLPHTVPAEILPGRVLLVPAGAGPGAAPPQEVEADEVLLLTGYEQDPSLFEAAGIELEGPGRAPRHDPETMETNVPGLFVAGTGAAGTQLGGVKAFIETSHMHVDRIMAALAGRRDLEIRAPRFELEES